MRQLFKDYWLLICTVWFIWSYTKSYRIESREKAIELYKTHMWPWLKEDRSIDGLYHAAQLCHYFREEYFHNLYERLKNDEILMKHIDIILIMGGFKVDGKEIPKEEMKEKIKNFKIYTTLTIIMLIAAIYILCSRHT